jgi:hypothetical protein
MTTVESYIKEELEELGYETIMVFVELPMKQVKKETENWQEIILNLSD